MEAMTMAELKYDTPYGVLVPQNEDAGVRRRNNNSISFFSNGNIKSISLQEQTFIKTSLGNIKAEYITFYESGEIKRLFPLNGKLSGYWSEEDEFSLAENTDFSFDFSTFSKKIISILFYKSGKVKALTLWPGEKVDIRTSQGLIPGRIGISLYESGALKSFEPKIPVSIKTSIGEIKVFDFAPLGVNGDVNSLSFFEEGEIKSLLTYSTKIEVSNKTGVIKVYEPLIISSNCEEGDEIKPLKIDFHDNKVIFNSKDEYILEENSFFTSRVSRKFTSSCSSCASCTGCN
jgi:antitoxin component YwqK of YwqJK toxin-antitoxin module